MQFNKVIGLGIAGNFAGHLEQAGEAIDFIDVEVNDPHQPKALFPLYVPSEAESFLSVYPFSHEYIIPPNDADNLQIEPEVALVCDVEYKDGKVVSLKPIKFGAFNDCSIRKPNAIKISEKKNWGKQSKGIASTLFDIDSLDAGTAIDQFRIASFHKRGNGIARYGEDCQVVDYSYFHQKLLNWIVDRMNNQQDNGPAENISEYLSQSNYPQQAIIAIGATRYTEYGETNFLQSGDTSIVVVYDGEQYSQQQIFDMARDEEFAEQGISALVQHVC